MFCIILFCGIWGPNDGSDVNGSGPLPSLLLRTEEEEDEVEDEDEDVDEEEEEDCGMIYPGGGPLRGMVLLTLWLMLLPNIFAAAASFSSFLFFLFLFLFLTKIEKNQREIKR